MSNNTLLNIERRLHSVQKQLLAAANEAETLSDQGLADDLHAMRQDLIMRLLPSVRRGRSNSTLARERT